MNDIYLGKPELAYLKRLDSQLRALKLDWDIMTPQMEYKFTKDMHGQIHLKINDRGLMYLVMRFADLEDPHLETIKPEDPPEWFMKLLGGDS